MRLNKILSKFLYKDGETDGVKIKLLLKILDFRKELIYLERASTFFHKISEIITDKFGLAIQIEDEDSFWDTIENKLVYLHSFFLMYICEDHLECYLISKTKQQRHTYDL